MARKPAKVVAISIRLLEADIETAREIASKTAIPYQLVIRGWVTRAADEARSNRGR